MIGFSFVPFYRVIAGMHKTPISMGGGTSPVQKNIQRQYHNTVVLSEPAAGGNFGGFKFCYHIFGNKNTKQPAAGAEKKSGFGMPNHAF